LSPLPSAALKAEALRLGFDLSGVAPAYPVPDAERFGHWLAQGCAGEMGYLERRLQDRLDPSRLLPNVKSVVCVALSYNPQPSHWPLVGRHPISCYAWGRDYHEVMREKLDALAAWMARTWGCSAKAYVDTGPVLERSYAARAGLGWIGKNTLLLNIEKGSFLFLGEILTDAEIAADAPVESLCGSCTLCLESCPTEALTEPGFLDARRCVSYLTLEHRSAIPPAFQGKLSGYMAGCDLCQACCPYNSSAPAGLEPAFQPRAKVLGLSLEAMRGWDEGDFKELAEQSALERLKPPMWKRNIEANS